MLQNIISNTRRLSLILVALIMSSLLSACGYNEFQALDEKTKADWSEVVNQYQRRSDLIPNIVNSVKGQTNFEQSTLTKVVEARAKATAIQISPEMMEDPQAMERFQQVQGQVGSALSRLLAVSENYPQLQANQAFQELRVQLEGTENRITVARNQYIKTVQQYNTLVRHFPDNLTAKIFGYKPKAGFTVSNEAEIAKPPVVDFN